MASRKHPALTIEKFELGEIDGDSFDHEAHVYIAWLYLNEVAVTEAIERFTLALRRLDDQTGRTRQVSRHDQLVFHANHRRTTRRAGQAMLV